MQRQSSPRQVKIKFFGIFYIESTGIRFKEMLALTSLLLVFSIIMALIIKLL